MFNRIVVRGLLAAAMLASAVVARAGTTNVFKMPAGETSLDFVTVGNPGNAADPATGYGAVGYTYQMGQYDVTSAQYCDFLNSVATTSDPYGLYATSMANTAGQYGCGIVKNGSAGSYTYSVLPGRTNMPVNYISWGDAARFCNWLQNGQPVGAEGPATTETGAYALNGATSDSALLTITRNPGAIYVIPTEDEWYKAAYYKGGGTHAGYWSYPTKSNTAPSNVLSATGTDNANYFNGGYSNPTNLLTPVGAFADSPGPYGTYDMGGDVWQWNEAIMNGQSRGLRGGDCNLSSADMLPTYTSYNSPPSQGWSTVGFRVAEVPEPGSITLLVAGAIAAWIGWRRR